LQGFAEFWMGGTLPVAALVAPAVAATIRHSDAE
jgi:hypothetical protein